jgi:membrane-bound metal-dependent hydrolase YbcI (DUF457 family)
MSSGPDHRVLAAVGVFGAASKHSSPDDHWSKHPIVAASIAAGFGTLPDLIEPATSPHHRQFFHSIIFAAAVAFALFKTYEWQPDGEGAQIVRRALLVAGAAYLIHLAADATTAKSVPFIGE